MNQQKLHISLCAPFCGIGYAGKQSPKGVSNIGAVLLLYTPCVNVLLFRHYSIESICHFRHQVFFTGSSAYQQHIRQVTLKANFNLSKNIQFKEAQVYIWVACPQIRGHHYNHNTSTARLSNIFVCVTRVQLRHQKL
jgi:hypothetical protein